MKTVARASCKVEIGDAASETESAFNLQGS